MRIYICLVVLSSLYLQGCFTVPGKDGIVSVDSFVNEDLGCIRTLKTPIQQVEYIPADQSFMSKIRYVNQCMINYSWGRGWNNNENFKN